MPGAGGTREWGVSRVWFQCGMLGNSVDGWHECCSMGMCAMPLAHTLADDRNGLLLHVSYYRENTELCWPARERQSRIIHGPSPSPSYLEILDLEPGQTWLALGTLSRQLPCLRWPWQPSQIDFLCSACHGWTKCRILSGWEEVHLKTKAVLQGSS